MFAPGDVVECVDDGPLRVRPPWRGRSCGLTRGALYTVAAFHPREALARWRGAGWRIDGVDLREVRHPVPGCPYDARRFRPVKRRDPELMRRLVRVREAVLVGSSDGRHDGAG